MTFQKHIFKSAVLKASQAKAWQQVQPTNMGNGTIEWMQDSSVSDSFYIQDFDATDMQIRYNMDGQSPWPVLDYRGEIELVPLDDHTSELRWSMVYVVDEMYALAAEMTINAFIVKSLKDIHKYLNEKELGLQIAHVRAA